MSFTAMRDALSLTEGNLANHAGRLEREGLIEVRRALAPNGFAVRYRITRKGAGDFRLYLRTLADFLDEHGAAAERDHRYEPAPDQAARPAALDRIERP